MTRITRLSIASVLLLAGSAMLTSNVRLANAAAPPTFVVVPSLGLDISCGETSSLSSTAFQPLTALNDSDPAAAKAAIASLRDLGQPGLDTMLAVYRQLESALAIQNPPASAANQALLARAKAALNEIAQQFDAHTSGLFWYTDLNQAKAAAQAQNKPILSLRLLGKLCDELSCANSRYFRSTLYANEEVAKVLREKYILHWESERPVPVITIDFGDGRKIERTITGNSIHYVLDNQGRVIDALPGLYSPAAFLRGLELARQMAIKLNRSPLVAFDECGEASPSVNASAQLQQYHQERLKLVDAQWRNDMLQLGERGTREFVSKNGLAAVDPKSPAAAAAMRVAFAKSRAEGPMLDFVAASYSIQPAAASASPLPAGTPKGQAINPEDMNDEGWTRLAALREGETKLDASSRRLIDSKEQGSNGQQLVETFEKSIALDTVKNEYLLHRKIHQWLGAEDAVGLVDLHAFNARVYTELFLTPSTDPWLGLATPDAYTALPGGGLTVKK